MSYKAASIKKSDSERRYIFFYVAILSMPVFLVSALILIEMHDPKVDPRAAAAMRIAPTGIPDTDNAYYALFGASLSEDQYPHAFGMRYVALNNAWATEKDAGHSPSREQLTAMEAQNKVLAWHGETKSLCNVQTDCLTEYSNHRQRIEMLLHDNPIRLARYHALYSYRGYRDTMFERMDGFNNAPYFGNAEHETILAQIGLEAIGGNLEGALRDLVADTAYWRRVLAGSNNWLSRSVSAAYLSRNYALASELVMKYQSSPLLENGLSAMLLPLSQQELDWSGVLRSTCFQPEVHVFLDQTNKYAASGRATRWFSYLIYRPNATINLLYQYVDKIQVLGSVPGYALIDTTHQLNGDYVKVNNVYRADAIYNFAGKILVAVAAQPPERMAKNIARIHNLEGAQRLLHLQLDIVRDRVTQQGIDAYLAKSAVALYDPYRNQPFRWDSVKHELWFEGINPGGKSTLSLDQRIAIRI